MMLHPSVRTWVEDRIDTAITGVEPVQELWSGYGQILRLTTATGSLILKQVDHGRVGAVHPRGWNTTVSHQRKLHSYEVESVWYTRWADRCGTGCRVPQCLGFEAADKGMLLLLEDLDASGFAGRHHQLDDASFDRCISWLAEFHATFLQVEPEGLWPQGTYWHLATRPDELAALADLTLRQAAPLFDAALQSCPYRTLVHGDAKVANVCFASDAVAMVDFQYVGGGVGLQDLVYFIGSCLPEASYAAAADSILDRYFTLLQAAIARLQPTIDGDAVLAAWRPLYPVAWADFERFLQGWCPGHPKMTSYSRELTRLAIAMVQKEL